MSGKRGNGEGSIVKRSDGRWQGSVRLNGHRHYVYGRTRNAVRDGLDALRARADAGQPVRDTSATTGAWLAEWAERVLPATGRRPATIDTYRSLARTHLVPALGGTPLRDLRPSHIQTALAGVASARSASTARQVYAVLRAALDDARRDGLIARNPCEDVKRPRAAASPPRALDAAQVRAILAAAEGHRLAPVVVLAAATGMRRGELVALRWEDVDLAGGVLRVERSTVRAGGGLVDGPPKSARGRRPVPLAPAVVGVLRTHYAAQAAERLRLGPLWAGDGRVFTAEGGATLDPRNLSRWYAGVCRAAGVEDTGIHALRHAAATAMLTGGAPVRVVADVLGHADVAMTLNVYAATLDGQAHAAAAGVADSLGLRGV